MTHTDTGEIGETVQSSYGMGGGNTPLVVKAIHEADGQDVTLQDDLAFSLVTGGASRVRVIPPSS